MLKSSAQYNNAYQSLNTEQRLAVDTIDGPVMVLAGPGTGKTQILATRIANILLKTDTNPSSILALTFTESGAQSMKKRLISLIGETAYYINISTFHSFCSEVIVSHPEYFAGQKEGEALSDLDRFHLFEKILIENTFEVLKPVNAPLLYIKAIIKSIQDLKREGITPEKFERILEQETKLLEDEIETLKKTEKDKRTKQLAKNQELLHIYKLYQQDLRETGRFDFEDMIAFVVEGFQAHPLLLQEYQEKLQYFLIDEYQDTNSAQNQVIQLLSSYWEQEANVFVVGDPNQSIYRFQGASLENTLSFLTTYPNATVISLKQNYRSTQTILDVAKALIGKETPEQVSNEEYGRIAMRPYNTALVSQKGKGQKLELWPCPSQTVEHLLIGQKIKKLIESGVNPKQIAVLYRSNAEAHPIAEVFSTLGIQYEIEGGSDVLQHPLISQLLNLFTVIRDIRYGVEDLPYFTLLNYSWVSLDPVVILKISRLASDVRKKIFDVIQALPSEEKNIAEDTAEPLQTFYNELSDKERNALLHIKEFQHTLVTLTGLDAQVAFPAWFESTINSSGLLPYILNQPDVVEQLNTLNTFWDEIKRQSRLNHLLKLEEFLQNIQIMQVHNLSLFQQDLNIQTDAVRLVTAHKSKGQEWEHVFVTGVLDKKWGNNTNRELIKLPEGILQHTAPDESEKNADERRLFYVALTRAKYQLYVTYPETVISSSNSRETTPSLFIEELPKELIQTVTHEAELASSSELITKLFTPHVATQQQLTEEQKISEQAFIASLLEKFKLSVTALNTYMECAYKFKLNNVFRIPRAKAPHLSFGTAMHVALEKLFKFMKDRDGEIPTLEYVLDAYTQALQKELLTPEEYIVRLAQGQTMLTGYYEFYKPQFVTPLAVERSFGSGFSHPMLEDIPLSGKLDKIELVNQVDKTVKVIDYKTGKPRSRNDIEGKTKSSNGNYKRQLVFYKLLTEMDQSFRSTVEQAEFDFVQPNPTGKFVKHSFHITDKEVEELKTVIRDVMTKIRNQEFPRTTDRSICDKCEFKQHCWGEV